MKKQEIEQKLHRSIQRIEQIRNKDGVVVLRLFVGNEIFVLKLFENKEYTREINIYKLFNKLGIRTLKIIELGDDYILMEDLNNSKDYHLACPEDLKNDEHIKNLALWYKQLHSKCAGIDLTDFYCENDLITKENIQALIKILPQKYIDLIFNFWDCIEKAKNSLDYTLTYNDFAIENLIVGKDCAFMFDYNFVGKGYVYADINNVLCMLDKERKQVFQQAYGKTLADFSLEKDVYNILSVLVSLIIASKREKFPIWANSILEHIKQPTFEENLKKLERIIYS